MSTSLNEVGNALRSPAATSFENSADQAGMPAWKEELNARLAAHRQRRPAASLLPDTAMAKDALPRDGNGPPRASRVAARVAERYAKAPSYSEFLAASAAAAAAAAEAAAFAAMQAQNAAEALARFASTEKPALEQALEYLEIPAAPERFALEPEDRRAMVEHPEPLPARGIVPPRLASASSASHHSGRFVDAFAEALVPAAVELPAKLIEFPRELIAPRKARPRIAEGPLAESLPPGQEEPPSLRIFEVGAAAMAGESGDHPGIVDSGSARSRADRSEGRQLAHGGGDRPQYGAQPAGNEAEQGAPNWQAIRLGEHPSSVGVEPQQQASLAEHGAPHPEMPVLHPASLADRTMAALVDGAIVAGAFLLFVLVFAMCMAHPPVDKPALAGAALVFAGLLLLYEWLFLSYGGGTLGMRYARIALCTFEDGNPTRQVLQRRVAASGLCALPLGLGLLWALFDEDSLGWHDRITRSYQRSYR